MSHPPKSQAEGEDLYIKKLIRAALGSSQMTGPTAKDVAAMPTPDLIRLFNSLKALGPNISLENMVTCKMAEDLIRKRQVAK